MILLRPILTLTSFKSFANFGDCFNRRIVRISQVLLRTQVKLKIKNKFPSLKRKLTQFQFKMMIRKNSVRQYNCAVVNIFMHKNPSRVMVVLDASLTRLSLFKSPVFLQQHLRRILTSRSFNDHCHTGHYPAPPSVTQQFV